MRKLKIVRLNMNNVVTFNDTNDHLILKEDIVVNSVDIFHNNYDLNSIDIAFEENTNPSKDVVWYIRFQKFEENELSIDDDLQTNQKIYFNFARADYYLISFVRGEEN